MINRLILEATDGIGGTLVVVVPVHVGVTGFQIAIPRAAAIEMGRGPEVGIVAELVVVASVEARWHRPKA